MPTRRRALQQIGLATGAAALAPWSYCQARPQSSQGKLGVALVGLGYYSTDLLAPALQQTEHCYLAGIVTGTPSKVPAWQRRYGIPDENVYDYDNFDRIADNPAIDVVYVVLPNSMHAEYTIRAARAGKHVWCEKPMALDTAECQAMIDACAQHRVSLALGYRMQHEPNTQQLMAFATGKPYGLTQLVTAAAGFKGNFQGDPRPWRTRRAMGGGAMYDMGVYSLQAARYTIGEEPLWVNAQHQVLRPEIFDEVDETTLFQLTFPRGAVAQCTTSFGINVNYLHVTYADGWARLDPFSSYRDVGGEASEGRLLTPWTGNQQARQMDDDALALKQGRATRVPGEEGLRDIRVLEAVYQSAREGRPVKV